MFGKRAEKQTKLPDPEVSAFNQSIIVHNMPSQARLTGNFSAGLKTGNGRFGLAPLPRKDNFKTVGLVIMLFGTAFIAALVYLSYRFIIAPTADKNKTASVKPVFEEQKKTTTTTAAIISVPVSTATTIIIPSSAPLELSIPDNATSSLMNEELDGQPGLNLPPLSDADKDTLIDEEEDILGTSAVLADSDGDTYNDAAEIAKSFNPAGAGLLSASLNLVSYINETYNYSLLYPKSWELRSLADAATVVLIASDDSLVQVSVQDNPDKVGILSWYENSFPSTTVDYSQLLSVNGWDGIMGTDNLNFYLTDSLHKNIYVVSYIPAVADRIIYPNIYKLIIGSLAIKE